MSHETLWFLESLAEVLIDGADTGDTYDAVTFTDPPGYMPPPHVHANESEGFLVLAGELTVHTAAGSRALRAGEAAHAPRSEPHTVEVTSPDAARYTVVGVPAGLVDFVRAVATPAPRRELPVPGGPVDVERLERIAMEHGITMVGPPGSLPADLLNRPA